jgi:hypothetical protein
MTLEYRRSVVLTSVPVTGCYRFDDDFQILPPEEKAPQPPYVMCHHPLIIEYKFVVDETPRTFPDGQEMPQWIINNDDAARKLNELLLLITTFSFFRVFVYQNAQSWFIPMEKSDDSIREVIWGQQTYYYKDFEYKIGGFSDNDLNLISRIDPSEYFNRYGRPTDQEFDLPESIDVLFDKYFGLDEVAKKAFLSSASLLSQGIKLWSEHPSLSFASLVSSLETLISFDHKGIKVETCKECGQERYRVVKKFRDFFGKYGSPTPEFRKYALKIYQYRSKILHSGELFLGEVSPRRFGAFDGFEDDELRRSIVRTCRICLINWLLLHEVATKA